MSEVEWKWIAPISDGNSITEKGNIDALLEAEE